MVIKMITKLGRRTDEHNENFNKDVGDIRKYQIEVTKMKNTITELNQTLEGCNID